MSAAKIMWKVGAFFLVLAVALAFPTLELAGVNFEAWTDANIGVARLALLLIASSLLVDALRRAEGGV